MTENVYDTIIIGGGSAGLTAAQVLGRARRKVALIDAGEPRNRPADHMHGYLGHDGLNPAELLAIGRREAQTYGIEIHTEPASRASRTPSGTFEVHLGSGQSLTARTLLVATGLTDVLPQIDGIAERFGKDVIHCPFCHGFEVRDRPLGVLGGDNAAMSIHQALMIPQWSRDMIFFTNGLEIDTAARNKIEARGVTIIEGKIDGLVVTENKLSAVRLADGTEVPREAVFVGPTFVPHDEILIQLGAQRGDTGFIPVGPPGPVGNVLPGVWAAGNVVNPMAQVIVAAGEGSMAAAGISAYLLELDIATELSD